MSPRKHLVAPDCIPRITKLSPVRPEDADKIIAAIEQQYGKGKGGSGGRAIHMGGEEPPVERISFRSHELDYATGGGVPIGRWTRLYGGQSAGKSLACWNIAAEAQSMGMSVAYYNIEKQFHRDFTAECGVDVDKLFVVEGTTIEEVGTKMEALVGAVHVHILDSCSSGTSIEELDGQMTDRQYAPGPRAWSKVFKRTLEHFDHNENTIIYIDQVRDKMDGSGVAPPGGRLMEHQSSLTLFFRRGSWLFRNEDGRLEYEGGEKSLSGMKEADGIEITVRCEKNRVSRPFRQAVMRYDLDKKKYDLTYELAKAAAYFDEDGLSAHKTGKPPIIPKTSEKSSYYKLPDGSTVQGQRKLADAIDGDVALQDKIAQIMKQAW
jgi:RecA/RadA recombinase